MQFNIPKASLFPTLFLLILFTACDEDDTMVTQPTYTIPATYNFENVSYSGQLSRLGMFAELKSYMSTSQTAGVVLDDARLQAMYTNDSANAGWSTDFGSKQMRNKTFASVQDDFDALLSELAMASQSTAAGAPGVSGVIESHDGAKSYLIGDDGLDHAQVIEKGLMGALLYYQATSVYFGEGKMNVDNNVVTEGEGTEMEHHWDEAFGYFGVPIGFPADLDGIVFWGNYSDQRNAILNSNQILMDAFLKGRAAISNDDLERRDEAIAEARDAWELVAVGSALHYINDGLAKFDDKALALHGLSEAIGFIYALKFNETKTISYEQIDALLMELAGSADFSMMNLYNTTMDDLQSVKDQLADYFNLADKKDDF